MDDASRAGKVVIFDLDGILWDDITARISRCLRTAETTASKTYAEAVISPLSLAPTFVERHAKQHIELKLNPSAVAAAKELADKGYEIRIRTVNMSVDVKALTSLLEESGVPIKPIEQVDSSSAKAGMIGGVRPVLIEDSPFVALLAARLGCKVILVEKSYNRLFGMLASHLNKNIAFVRGEREVPAAVERSFLSGAAARAKSVSTA